MPVTMTEGITAPFLLSSGCPFFTLGTMPGSDMAGFAGYTDEVNNNYLRIFGSAVLMSPISGGQARPIQWIPCPGHLQYWHEQYAHHATGNGVSPAQLGQATSQLLQKT